jgi:hypothetical protein
VVQQGSGAHIITNSRALRATIVFIHVDRSILVNSSACICVIIANSGTLHTTFILLHIDRNIIINSSAVVVADCNVVYIHRNIVNAVIRRVSSNTGTIHRACTFACNWANSDNAVTL